MSNIFQIGQLVEPKAGGPTMKVVSVVKGTIQEAYQCSWLVDGKEHSGEFLGEALKAADTPHLLPQEKQGEERSLCPTNQIHNAHVFGANEKSIGEIDHLLIDLVSGKIAYALVSFSGVTLVHRRYPVPWSALRYDPSLQGFRSSITETQLQEAPALTPHMTMDREWETRAHQHYEAPTYWGSTTAHQRSGSS
jgi:uncharacterized protein YodC (DUF2158 family)